mmetsp:Transcript_33922/g.62818  ORF Transcript_33922/g.62818 Transcript_33922/m.62818 type:complete len:120 (-) Transcript_33922:73-432(-)
MILFERGVVCVFNKSTEGKKEGQRNVVVGNPCTCSDSSLLFISSCGQLQLSLGSVAVLPVVVPSQLQETVAMLFTYVSSPDALDAVVSSELSTTQKESIISAGMIFSLFYHGLDGKKPL